MPDLRSKALAYVREGRVVVTTAATLPDARRPALVVATVRGQQQAHTVTLSPHSGWSCTCWRTEPCAHLAAVAISTGAPGYAARPEHGEHIPS